ncbi:MAG: DJ-1/PfpI family protein [Dehalococcoidia bacterium]
MTRTVGIVLYPDVEELDFVGPLEVLGQMAMLDREWKVVTIAESGGVVNATHGLKATVDHSFDDAPELDVILVPGGLGTRQAIENPRLVEFVRQAGATATYVTSVCTGALILHRAGFLTGKRATTHWGAIELLRGLGDVEIVNERFVQDGNVITSAGVSAGIDMALYLVSLLKDDNTAKNVQKMMEYYPQPPVFAEAKA